MTDSDGAGFVIRNFLKGTVDKSKIKNCYIPQLSGKEKRKVRGSAEGFLGVEGVPDDVIIEAVRKSGAEIIGEETVKRKEITKADLYSLGLTGTVAAEHLNHAGAVFRIVVLPAAPDRIDIAGARRDRITIGQTGEGIEILPVHRN